MALLIRGGSIHTFDSTGGAGGGGISAGENFRGRFVFQIGADVSPPNFFLRNPGHFSLAPWVRRYHFPSVGRYRCLCIACQDQSLCECVSQNFFLV